MPETYLERLNRLTTSRLWINKPTIREIDLAVKKSEIETLRSAFPDCRAALEVEGLTVGEFEEFGPVRHFRSNSIAGRSWITDALTGVRAATP
jgi:hypothetical protein